MIRQHNKEQAWDWTISEDAGTRVCDGLIMLERKVMTM